MANEKQSIKDRSIKGIGEFSGERVDESEAFMNDKVGKLNDTSKLLGIIL